MFEFIEDTHKYILDGEEIPCVSEITRFVQRELYKDSDPCAMEVAADRGTRVHRACEEIDRTGTVECDPNISGYVRAYTKFLSEHDVKWDKVEYIIHGSLDCGEFAGTLDRLGTVDGEKTLLDIKTTSKITNKHKYLYSLQMTGYLLGLMNEPEALPEKIAVLQLQRTGDYKLIYLSREVEGFVACMMLHGGFKFYKNMRSRKKNG